MVSIEELNELFYYKDGNLYGKNVSWRRKASNSRVYNKKLGTPNKTGHLILNFKTKDGKKHRWLVHRLIYFLCKQELPDIIDHINRNPSDNRIENLRSADHRINSINRDLQSNSSTNIRGVSFNKRINKYEAYIKNYGVRYHLGHFNNIDDASLARKMAEEKYYNDF